MDKFVLQVPKWQGELLFSREILVFVGVILLLLVGTLFCFWGYKYFRTVLFLGIGIVMCYGSYLLVEPMTANLVIRMFLTVSLTFLGVCFVYFLDIIFGYVLDRFRVRSMLGKRSYLLTAPLGAAILGLTIYYCIWRDAVTALVIALCCMVPGLIFQHHKRKKMVRFKCYNDLLRLRRPQFDEDGLEILSMGTVKAAALASVASVLVTPEPEPESVPVATVESEPEPESVPVAAVGSEPEPESVPVAVVEPERVSGTNAEQRALSEIESEFAYGPEYRIGMWSEPKPEPVPVAAVESEPESVPVAAMESEPEPVHVAAAEPEPEPAPVPFEISDAVKDLILRKMETDEELLEEAFFVKKISKKMAEKQDEDIHIETISPVYPGKITIAGKDRKSRRKREEGKARAAAIAVAGLGAFIVGRISKGGD